MSQILLVEPDKLLAKIYQSALKKAGHQVRVVASSQQAINSADRLKPDIVILELQLIGHSGIEFLYEFRSYEDWQAIPVILHSQVPYLELQDSWPILSNDLGVTLYYYKPTTKLSDLVTSVKKVSGGGE